MTASQHRVRIKSLQDLADHLGLSKGTVSRALNNNPRVKAATRRRVFDTARELGFSPNPLARALRGARTGTIGLVMPYFTSTIHATTLSTFHQRIKSTNRSTLVELCGTEPADRLRTLQHFQAMRVDGIIITAFHLERDASMLQFLQTAKLPWVLLNPAHADQPWSVQLDRYNAYEQIIDHLIEQGHRSFCFLGVGPTQHHSQLRINGAKAALLRHGLDPDQCLFQVYQQTDKPENQNSLDYGAHLASEFLNQKIPATALLASNDEVAVAVIHQLRRASLRIPQDLSLVGFDNLSVGRYSEPTLTSIDQNIPQTVDACLHLLERRVQQPDCQSPPPVLIEPRLVCRHSVASARMLPDGRKNIALSHFSD